MTRYAFRAVEAGDVAMLNRWLGTEPVRRWWIEADGSPASAFSADRLGEDDGVEMRIVSLDGHPFAYAQSYDPHRWPGHHFEDLPPGSRGIDQFIGVPELIGLGHGPAFIRLLSSELAASGAPVVGTDPHPENTAAIRAYGKAGFRPLRERLTDWGPAFLMVWSAVPAEGGSFDER